MAYLNRLNEIPDPRFIKTPDGYRSIGGLSRYITGDVVYLNQPPKVTVYSNNMGGNILYRPRKQDPFKYLFETGDYMKYKKNGLREYEHIPKPFRTFAPNWIDATTKNRVELQALQMRTLIRNDYNK